MRKYLLHVLIISFAFAFQVSAYDKTDLKKAKATRDCSDCDLSDADLSGANLRKADLYSADLRNANLSGACLSEANLSEVLGLNIEQLSKVETLYKAKLDPELMEQVEDKYPHLLEEPK